MKFEQKSSEQLANQLKQTEEVLDTEFFSESNAKEDILGTSDRELKVKYPYRHEQYLKILRAIMKKKHEFLRILEPYKERELDVSGVSSQKELSVTGLSDESRLENQGNLTMSKFSDFQFSDEKIQELQDEFMSARNYITLINNLETYIQSYEEGGAENKLREHQQDVFHDLVKFFNEGRREGYIEMPTGTGKTAVFVTLVKALAAKKDPISLLKTLILVPGQDLIHQTIGKDEKGGVVKNQENKPMRGFAAFASEINATSYYEKNKDLSGEVVVSTYQSFINLMENGKIGNDFADLIICDEAHRALGHTTAAQIRKISPKAVKIGLTATSEYTNEKGVSNLFPTRIHQLKLREAIESRILAPLNGVLYNTGFNVNDVKLNSRGDYTEATLKQLNNEARNKAAVEAIRGLKENDPKLCGIVSCVPGDNLAHAVRITEMIQEIQINDPITGQMRNLTSEVISGKDKDRSDTYDRFERGEIDFLTFVDVLKEGWDSEKAKLLIRLRPTRSRVLATQILGRILRKNSDNQSAMVIEFEDEFTKEEMRPYTAFDVLEQREIVQGGLIAGPLDDTGDGDKGRDGEPRLWSQLPPELLAQLNIKPTITRELVGGLEKLEQGVIMCHDEIYMDTSRLSKYFNITDNKSSDFERLSEDDVKVLKKENNRYYEIKDIGRVLLDDENFREAIDEDRSLSLRVISNLTGMQEYFFIGISNDYDLPAKRLFSKKDNFSYNVYEFNQQLWGLVKKEINVKVEFLELIFKNRELKKEDIEQFYQQAQCTPSTLINLLRESANVRSLRNISNNDKKQILFSLRVKENLNDIRQTTRQEDEWSKTARITDSKKIEKKIYSIILEQDHKNVRNALRKIEITKPVQGLDKAILKIEKKWSNSREIVSQCRRLRKDLQEFSLFSL